MLLPLGLSVLVPAAGAAAAPPPSAVAHPGAGTDSAAGSGVRVERGRISANIGEAPMAPILGAVGRDLGAEVLVRGDLGLTRAQAFADLPLLDGLERLIQPNHLVIEFAPQRQGVVPRIMRIRVFGLGAATDPSIEPVVLGAAGGSNSAAAAQNSPVAGFDGHLGWSYDNPSRLPPLAQRVRRIGSIYAASGTSGLDALQTVVASDPDFGRTGGGGAGGGGVCLSGCGAANTIGAHR